jgi:predicted ArsR family transcriptional regulator
MQDEGRERFPDSVAVIGRKRETARQEFSMRRRLLALLRERGPLTVPEIAGALGLPSADIHWWLMGLVRYNQVSAGEKADDEGYYRYALIEGH